MLPQPSAAPRETARNTVDGRLSIPNDARSPALDLQRRLESQVLRSFYVPSAARPVGRGSRAALAIGIACGGWAMVFGMGALLVK